MLASSNHIRILVLVVILGCAARADAQLTSPQVLGSPSLPTDTPVRLDPRTPPSHQANGTTLVVPPSLKKKNRFSPAVLSAQRQLSAQGFANSMNGVLDAQTRRALFDYQTAHGLPQTSQLDTPTRNALNGR